MNADWRAPPSADEVRGRDQERLLDDPAFTEELSEEDVALARALLARRSAEEIAAALVRWHRDRLPAPEELFDGGPASRDDGARGPRERKERPPRQDRPEERSTGEGMALFRMSVGRRNNADPRWLLPIICRLGHVTKKEVGAIRIFDRETRFEIVEHAAARFAAAVGRATPDENIQIESASRSNADEPKRSARPSRNTPSRPEAAKRPSRPAKPPRKGSSSRAESRTK